MVVVINNKRFKSKEEIAFRIKNLNMWPTLQVGGALALTSNPGIHLTVRNKKQIGAKMFTSLFL